MRFSRAASARLALATSAMMMAGACSFISGADETATFGEGPTAVAGPQTAVTDGLDQSALRTADTTVAPAAPVDGGSVRAGADTAEPSAPAPAAGAVPPAPSGSGTVTSLQRPDAAPPAPSPSSSSTTATTAPPSSTVATAPESTTTSAAAVTSSSAAPVSSSVLSPVLSSPEELSSAETYSADLLNGLRTGLQLDSLTRQADMDAFAREWSKQMAETGAFEHSNGPYGENIAYTTNTALTAAEAADLFHELWTESPGHYRNMTNESYVTTGIGLYLTDNGWYGTHVFGF